MNLARLTRIDKATLGKIPGVLWVYNFFRLTVVPTYRQDGLSTVHNSDFMNTPRFREAYKAALKQEKLDTIQWRTHTNLWAAIHASKLEGDFVECGVNRGFYSAAIMNYVNFNSLTDKKYYLFDTYAGFDPTLISEKDRATNRQLYPDCYQFVVDSFKSYPNAVIVKGSVPSTLTSVKIDKVAYLSIDMNCVQPELDALIYFWPKMVKGGVIVLDDYAYSGYLAQKESADKFAASVGAEVLSLPTGQGLILKY